MRKYLAIITLGLIANLGAVGQQTFQKKELTTPTGDTLRYQVLLPKNYDANKKFPLVIFLHGAGERSSDNMLQLKHGSGMFLNPANQEKYPAIVLFPQCPLNQTWIGKEIPPRTERGLVLWDQYADTTLSPTLGMVKKLIDQYLATEKVDKRRVYLVGLSMGGMGTFDLAARYPDLFAAAIPICGGIYPPRLKQAAKKVSFRIYHGDDDPIVHVDGSRKAYLALRELGAKVDYVEFSGTGHNSWTPAFNQPDFLSWLFKQRRK